ncbi:MAG: 1-(5-phosphoribosyl)-5-[(5-phosphoribosylamino)methylideneamino]imidazole-4-carboxamide isomerase [Moorellales bacterium]
MLVIPAIDLRSGRCVRLFQGRADRETVYSDDPVAVARRWEAEGATWLHVVDLDGAFTGRPQNWEVVRQIVAAVSIPVELGGGIRTWEEVEGAIALGVKRVILGTAAVTQPELVRRACAVFGEAVAVSLDAKEGRVAVAGWETTAGASVLDLAISLREWGLARIIYTDVRRDGTLTGPNLEATRAVARASGLKVIAAGGVSSLEDIRALKELEPLGVEGVIVGQALYTGALDLKAALALAAG